MTYVRTLTKSHPYFARIQQREKIYSENHSGHHQASSYAYKQVNKRTRITFDVQVQQGHGESQCAASRENNIWPLPCPHTLGNVPLQPDWEKNPPVAAARHRPHFFPC
ncbi:hypothetical protein M569_17721 [Genlisea aurea]|uniref:Uncharacterized protein n=1 Tax=Genlisea aurea TaxID=192259 RepID=S8D360_9LAMI|nr:hypothetical protein M569_17721 [Genlisea aurea]